MSTVYAIDVETACANAGSICAIGLCRVHPTKQDELMMNCRCDPGMEFDAGNIAVHGIRQQDVEGALSLEQALRELFALLPGATVAAHNASFDIGQIKAAAARFGLEVPTFTEVCTVKLARRCFPGRKSYALAALRDLVPFPFVHHDAYEDARACAAIYRACEREQRVLAMAAQIAARYANHKPM